MRLSDLRLWFVVPACGRFEMARACLRQLRRTCDALCEEGLYATAVVVADDENLDVADELGFATVRRRNRPLGRKWNDGYELACSPALNPHPATHVIPFGSDDWIDPAFVLQGGLPERGHIRCARESAVVREDGSRLARLRIGYPAGDGVRIFHARLFEPFDWRPAAEDASRALDTSVWSRLKSRPVVPEIVYFDLHPLQIVDFKSPDGQLNTYAACRSHLAGANAETRDPWGTLERVYGAEPVQEMRSVYQPGLVAA